MNEDGTSVVVEIDETKFFHRKYHRGQWRPGHWVFGGIERGSGKCFLVEVPDRRAVTLKEAIVQYILPRSFVDPNDDAIHTQNVENLWMQVKRKLRRQFGTSETLFTSHLHEFVWRERHKNSAAFSAFICSLTRQHTF